MTMGPPSTHTDDQFVEQEISLDGDEVTVQLSGILIFFSYFRLYPITISIWPTLCDVLLDWRTTLSCVSMVPET
jgi:hypothetical protein